MRILADTNVLVSARFWKGNEFQFPVLSEKNDNYIKNKEED